MQIPACGRDVGMAHQALDNVNVLAPADEALGIGVTPPSRLIGMGPCGGTSSGPSTLSRLSFLAAIVISCFLGHLRFLGPSGGGRHRFRSPSSVDLMRGAREDKELAVGLLLGALECIEQHTHGA